MGRLAEWPSTSSESCATANQPGNLPESPSPANKIGILVLCKATDSICGSQAVCLSTSGVFSRASQDTVKYFKTLELARRLDGLKKKKKS